MSRVAKVGLALGALVAPLVAWFALRHRPVQAAPSEADAAWNRLAAFDDELRAKVDFAKLATWDEVSGPDPYRLVPVPGVARLVGVLRGADALVVLDSELRELQRLEAPAGPVAVALSDDGTVIVAGDRGIARYAWKGGALVSSGTWELEGVLALRDVATGPNGWVYLVEEHEGQLVAFRFERRSGVEAPGPITRWKLGSGPVKVERIGRTLVANCLLDHQLVIVGLEPGGAPNLASPVRITHDGPFWSFAARMAGDALLVAAGGVEDHPLDRTIGAFGYVDSFLYLYRVDLARREAKREALLNLSEIGIVTPKAVALETSPSIAITATGYASDKLARVEFDADTSRPPRVRVSPFVPGATSLAESPNGRLVFADPLLDAWVAGPRAVGPDTASAPDVVPVSATRPRTAANARLGEALFFTTLMAPFNRSDGALSRFTCETCHFEGYVDGRTHHTGRGDVHAVTKPLLGLWNNRPHFSRALDDDLVTVAFNEFRVAGAKSEHDPWFSLRSSDAPWLSWLGAPSGDLSPEVLRGGLMAFLMAFNHRPNPAILGRSRFSELERAGAVAFRDRCESCHEARLASDRAESRAPFERWEQLVFAREGAIVWGKAEYQMTGIEPYVHEKGARVPSLRRLYKKRPYFTNGSAKDLETVLAQVRVLPEGFRHAAPISEHGEPLDEPSRTALRAFLDLL